MKVVSEVDQVKDFLNQVEGEIIGFIPTMGALHQGHISLIDRAKSECNKVVVSIFVNPTQFNDKNDLKNYPRTLEADLQLLGGVDLVFVPTVEEIYPQHDTRIFDFGTLDKVMEGATRPGHFNGVAQVVSRLFDIVAPNRAYFGEKDFQQIAIIEAMCRQLHYNIDIVHCPIIREKDGLAMSSRNTLLSRECRDAAGLIYRAMCAGRELKNVKNPKEVTTFVTEMIDANPFLKVIYFQIVDSSTLETIDGWGDCQQGCIAVQAGSVRLIDNIQY